jgi:hypothetical protein
MAIYQAKKLKIKGYQSVEVEITESDLSYCIMGLVLEKLKLDDDFDDAGMDWLTELGNTYIGSPDWLISKDSKIAVLVDAANILRYGTKMNLS